MYKRAYIHKYKHTREKHNTLRAFTDRYLRSRARFTNFIISRLLVFTFRLSNFFLLCLFPILRSETEKPLWEYEFSLLHWSWMMIRQRTLLLLHGGRQNGGAVAGKRRAAPPLQRWRQTDASPDRYLPPAAPASLSRGHRS